MQLFPQVRDAVLDGARRLAPDAWVRQCASVLPLSRRLNDPKGLLIDWLSRAFRTRAEKLGVRTNPAFAGTYTYRPDADFPKLFPGFLEGLPEGGLVMCHPGHVDAELDASRPADHDPRARICLSVRRCLSRGAENARFDAELKPFGLRQHFLSLYAIPPG